MKVFAGKYKKDLKFILKDFKRTYGQRERQNNKCNLFIYY